MEKVKIKKSVEEVFNCSCDEAVFLRAYCTCVSIAEQHFDNEDIKNAYVKVRNSCSNSEAEIFLHVKRDCNWKKLANLCSEFSNIELIEFFKVGVSQLVCSTLQLLEMKRRLKLSVLNTGYVILMMNQVHKIVSQKYFATVTELDRDVRKQFDLQNTAKLKIGIKDVVDLYKAVCMTKLDIEEFQQMISATKAVSLCVENGIPKERIPELMAIIDNSSKLKRFVDNTGVSYKIVVSCAKKLVKLRYNEIELMCAASYAEDKNDILLDNCYIYPRFMTNISDGDKPTVVITCPSDFFIRKMIFDTSFRDIDFVVILPSQYKCKLYRRYCECMNYSGTGSIKFHTFEEFSEFERSVDSVLVFATHTEEKYQIGISDILFKHCKTSTQIFSLHETDEFENTTGAISQLIYSNDANIQSIDILPLGLSSSEGRKKKVFVRWSVQENIGSNTYYENAITLNKYVLISSIEQYISRDCQEAFTSKKELIESGSSIREIFRGVKYINKSGQKREMAKEYTFSEGISAFYTIHNGKSEDNKIRLRVYFKMSTENRKGVIIPGTEMKFRGVSVENIYDVIENEFLYGKNGDKLLRDYLKENTLEHIDYENISLKSFFYLYFDWYIWKENDDNDFDFVKTIVDSKIGELPIVKASVDEFEKAYYEQHFGFDELTLDKYINLLSEIFEVAVNNNICENNIFESFSPSSEYENRSRYDVAGRARDALVKHSLMKSEIRQVYKDVSKKLKSSKYEYLAVMIKMATGLNHSQICELTWRDFLYSQEYDFYMLFPSDTYNKNIIKGAMSKVPVCIPCVPLLSDELIKRKNELSEKYDEEEIRLMPIVPTLNKKSSPYEHCKRKDIKELCESVLDFWENNNKLIKTSGRELVLKSYRGDVLRETFIKHLTNYTNLNDNERAVILGLKPNDTADRHYIGYDNEDVACIFYEELCKLEKIIKGDNKDECDH